MSYKKAFLFGGITGVGIVLTIFILYWSNLFWIPERIEFRLCPLFLLGFAPISWAALVAINLLSNFILYGIFGLTIFCLYNLGRKALLKMSS